ncbi:MAG: hypothetical protein FH749_14155 [Firmicutes bacterium]|nr:hypothetical protein [Bacillota bacterium]
MNTVVITEKKKRFRQDKDNPYRSRYMLYKLIDENGHLYIEVEQQDFVLNSKVASSIHCTPEIRSRKIGNQLIEYMLNNVREIGEVGPLYSNWQSGKIALIVEQKNMLVKEAIRKRFARNLKRI